MEARAVRRLHVIGVTLFAALMAILAGGGAWVGHYLLADRDRIFLAALAQTTTTYLAHDIADHQTMLGMLVLSLAADPRVAAAFAARDRGQLMSMSQPVLKGSRDQPAVDHVCFILPDHRVLLRGHAPDIVSDVVTRDSLARAERDNGVAGGIETGYSGDLMLRVVAPVQNSDGTRIGFVEAAIDMTDLVASLGEAIGGDLVLLVDKDAIDPAVRQRMRTLSVPRPGWAVVTGQSAALSPEGLAFLEAHPSPQRIVSEFVPGQDRRMGFVLMPLPGALHTPAWLMVTRDFSTERRLAKETVGVVVPAGIAVAALLVGLVHLVLRRIERIVLEAEERRDHYQRLADRDSLTGCLCRREFDRLIATELGLAQDRGTSVGLLMLDLDHFKRINDTRGHVVGDEVLKVVVAAVQDNVRPNDHLARFGGEEFCLIVPGATPVILDSLGVRLLDAVRAVGVALPCGGIQPVTVSIGMALSAPDSTVCSLISQADQALYRAKRNGRDQVVPAWVPEPDFTI